MSFWDVLKNIGKAGLNIATGGVSGAIPGLGVGGGGNTSKIIDAASQVGASLGAASTGRAKGRQAEADINQNQDALRARLAQMEQDRVQNMNVYNANQATGQNNFNLNENGQQNDYNLSTAASKNNYGLNRINAASTINGMDLAQRNFQLQAPGARAGNAVRGDILANAQDIGFSGLPKGINVPTISGGLRPSMFSANTRALGSNMSAQALREQERGDTFNPLPDLPNYTDPAAFVGTSYTAPSPYVTPPPVPSATPLPQSGKLDTVLNTASTIGALAPTFEQILAAYKKRQQPISANGTADFVGL